MSRKTTAELTAAFAADGFDVAAQAAIQGARGLLAASRSAVNYETRQPKQALYVEGTPYQMGWLIGRLAPQDVRRMATEFVENIVPAFINEHTAPAEAALLKDLLACLMVDYCSHVYSVHPDIPADLLEEMHGLVDGCREAGVSVDFRALLALNAGVDCLLSFIYAFPDLEAFRAQHGTSPRTLAEHLEGLAVRPGHARFLRRVMREHFRVPIHCNAFAVSGGLTEGGATFFGRDFMFPTAGVFEYTACPIIYNPDSLPGASTLPLLSMAAPGFVGSIAAMNAGGLGMGVDMACSVLCDITRPGLNALLMVRHCIQNASSAEGAVDRIANAQRGVSWLYPIAEGRTGRSLVVEAGRRLAEPIDFLSYPPEEIRSLLPPTSAFQPDRNGMMVRWNDYVCPGSFLQYNPALFHHFQKPYLGKFFTPCGYLDQTWVDADNPESFYYAPQRENLENMLVVTNAFLTPEMRTVAMHPWTNDLNKPHLSDFQWRYDELTHELLKAVGKCGRRAPKKIGFDQARNIIDFLNPNGAFPDYYANNPASSDGLAKVIEGSTSLFDLTNLVMTSHYGFYPDEWVTIHLGAYV